MPLVGKRKKRSVGSKSESQTVHENKNSNSSSSGSSAHSRVSPEPQVSTAHPSLETSSTSPVASAHGGDPRRSTTPSAASPVEVVEACDATFVVSVSIGSDSAEGSSGHKASCVSPESNSSSGGKRAKTRRSGVKKRASRSSETVSPSSPTSDRVLRSATRGLKLDPSSLGVAKRSCSSASPETPDVKEKRSRLSECLSETSNTGTCASKTASGPEAMSSNPNPDQQQSVNQEGNSTSATGPQAGNSNFMDPASVSVSSSAVPLSTTATTQWLLQNSNSGAQSTTMELAGLAATSGSGSSAAVLDEAMMDAAGQLQQLLHQGFTSNSNFAPRVHQILQRSVTHNIASQFNQLISQLERSGDNHEKILLLNEINEMIMLGNEDSLAGVNVKQLVKPLGVLLREDDTAMLVISATRVVYSLLDSLPRSSSQLLDVLPTLLHIVSAPNDFIDLKEQAVKAIELISKRHGARIVQEDGVAICLNVIDFLDTGVQRTVLNAIVNCFGQMRREDFPRVGPCLGGLAMRLRQAEPRTAERVALAFGKLVEAHRRDPVTLKRIAASPDFFPNLQSMLMTNNPPLSRPTYHVIVRMLTTMCSSCPDLAVVLLKDGIASTLLHILECISGSSGGGASAAPSSSSVATSASALGASPGKSGGLSSMSSGASVPSWMNEVSVDVVTLCCELMPSLPETSDLFAINTLLYQKKLTVDWQWMDDNNIWRSYLPEHALQIEQAYESHVSQISFVVDNRHYILYPADLIQYNEETERSRQIRRVVPTPYGVQTTPSSGSRRSQAAPPPPAHHSSQGGSSAELTLPDSRAVWFNEQEEAAGRVIRDLLPRLYDVWREASGPAMLRHKCLEAMLRMLYISSRHMLMEVLKQQQLSSHLAQMLGNQEDPKVVVAGLQMTEIMLDRVIDIFGPFCRKEGIVFQLDALRRKEHNILAELRAAESAMASGPSTAAPAVAPITMTPSGSPTTNALASGRRSGGRSGGRPSGGAGTKSRRRPSRDSLSEELDSESARDSCQASGHFTSAAGGPGFEGVPPSPPVGGKHRRSAAPAGSTPSSGSGSSFFSSLNPSRIVRKIHASATARHKATSAASVAGTPSAADTMPPALSISGGESGSPSAGGAGSLSGSPSGASSHADLAMSVVAARFESEKQCRLRVLNWIVDRASRMYDLYMQRRRSRGTARNSVKGCEGSMSQDTSLSGMEASGVTFSESGLDDDSRQMDVDVEELEDDGQEAMVKLKQVAHALKQFSSDPNSSNEGVSSALRTLADILSRGVDVTPFQLSHSELVSSLKKFLSASDAKTQRWDLFCEVFYPPAISQSRRLRSRTERRRSPRRSSTLSPGGEGSGASDSAPADTEVAQPPFCLTALVSRLLQCVHHDEHFALRGHAPANSSLNSGLVHSLSSQHMTCEFRAYAGAGSFSGVNPETIRSALEHQYRIDLLTKVGTIERHLLERISELSSAGSAPSYHRSGHHHHHHSHHHHSHNHHQQQQQQSQQQASSQPSLQDQLPSQPPQQAAAQEVAQRQQQSSSVGSALGAYHPTRLAGYRSAGGEGRGGGDDHLDDNDDDEDDDDEDDDDDSDYEISESMATLSTAGGANTTSNVGTGRRRAAPGSGSSTSAAASGNASGSSGQGHGLRLQLLLNDHLLPSDITLLQAIRNYGGVGGGGSSAESQPPLEMLTAHVLVLNYRQGVPPSSASSPSTSHMSESQSGGSSSGRRRHVRTSSGGIGSSAKKLRKDLGYLGGMPPTITPFVSAFLSTRELKLSDPSVNALSLLQSLFSLSRFAYAINVNQPPNSPVVMPSEFASSKLDSKVSRQLQDSVGLLVGEVPRWLKELAHACPFLFPFETRLQIMQLTEFDRPRIFHRLQESAGELTDTHQGQNPLHSSSERALNSLALQKRKVSMPRVAEDLFKAAERTFEQMGNSLNVLEVHFAQEEGTGLGPTLEFYTLLSREFQKSSHNLWRAPEVTSEGYIVSSCGLYPAPWGRNTNTRTVRAAKSKFRFLGQLLARAIIDNRPLDLPLSPLVYRWLLGDHYYMTGADMSQVDPDLHSTYIKLYRVVERRKQIRLDSTHTPESRRMALNSVTMDGCRVDDLCLTFTLPGYENVELIRNGRNEPVRLDNLEQYLEELVQWTLIKGVSRQMLALKEGFETVLPCRALRYLLPEELDMVLCGAELTAAGHAAWEVPALMEVCRCDHGYTLDSRPVQNMFAVMAQFSTEERRQFLQFVTGSPRLPVGGFRALRPPLTIVKHHETDPDQYLPSVMTCVNYLKLPNYSCLDTLREKLLVAMKDGQMSFSLS